MDALQAIQSVLERTARRRRLARMLHGMWWGLLVGGVAWVVALVAYKLLPLPLAVLGWAAALAALCPLAGALWGGWRRESLTETARWLDLRQNLKERLSTALELAGTGTDGWRELVVQDAAVNARGLNTRRLVPFHLPPAARWSVLVLAIGAGLGFVPEYRSPKYQQKQADAANIRHVGQQLAELTRREVERRPPVLPATEKSLETLVDLGEKLQKASLTRGDALRELASVSEQLRQQLKDLRTDPALRKLEQAARAPDGGDAPYGVNLQQQIEQLQRELGRAATNTGALADLQRNFEQLQQAAQNLATRSDETAAAQARDLAAQLSTLTSQAAELGLLLPGLDAAIAALAAQHTDLFLKELDQALTQLEKLRDLAQRLEALQGAWAKLGKNLAEQLERGQAGAAAHTLRKMAEQLRSAALTPEQLQQILSEVSQALPHAMDYGNVADLFERALEQGRQGDRGSAAQQLAAAADELENLLRQLGDTESLLAALENLERASACIGSGQRWGQCRPGVCSSGLSALPGTGGREAGMAPAPLEITPRDAEPSDALKPTKVRGQFSPGAPMPSITLKGVSIKGASRLQYEEAVAAAQAEAQSALSQEKVPRAYHAPVRDYFDDLRR